MSESAMLEAAIIAAKQAGEILRQWGEKFTVSEKGPNDLVTEADVASQKAIHAFLSGQFPDHGYLGEEGLNAPAGPEGYRWVIDPLDGTSNYVHRFPYYAVSIGLQKGADVIGGVIYDPTRDETFASMRGCGATLNGKPLRPSRFNKLAQAMVIASFPPGVKPESDAIKRFLNILTKAQAVHRSGSAALNLAYVAAGRLDGFWSSSLHPWDMAAGAAILTEAGGKITQMSGNPLQIEVPDLLATNGTGLHEELSAMLR